MHEQQVQDAQVHTSHLQQLLHVSAACAVIAVPSRAVVISRAIRIVFISFSSLGLNIQQILIVNQEEIGGRRSGGSVRSEHIVLSKEIHSDVMSGSHRMSSVCSAVREGPVTGVQRQVAAVF